MFMRSVGLFLLLFGLVAAMPANASQRAIKLTDKGNPQATIVIAKYPTLAAAFAAKELKEHIKLITGADLPIVNDTVEVNGVRLLVGDSWQAAKLGLSSKDYKDQEYSVTYLPDAIVFLGKDVNVVAPATGELPMPDFFQNRSSMTAVYDFLYHSCGVRWYVPGDIGICYDAKPTLIVKGDNVKRAPDMKYLWMYNVDLFAPTAKDLVPRPVADLWKLRINSGGQQFSVNHSFYGYYDRYLKDHPLWFAQGYGDTGTLPPQLCFTNPEVIAQVVQDARDYFDGKGLKEGAQAMGDVFGLVPMDNNDYCKCATCQAELNSAKKNDENFSGGYASNYIWGFINKVAKEVKKTHPDKYVGALAYWDYADYPTNMRLESNIKVMMCLDPREWYMPQTRDSGMKVYNSWVSKEKDRALYLWLYFCFPALAARGGTFEVFPGYYANTALKHSEMFRRDNIQGIFFEHSSEAGLSHLLDLPELYLTMVMGRDSKIKGKQAYAEFFKKFYGNSAKPMKQLYEAIEDTYYNPKNYPTKNVWFGGQNEKIAWGSLGTPERMAKFAKYMDQAKNAARTDLEKSRVAYFEEGIWKSMLKGNEMHKDMERMRQTEPPKVSIPQQALEINGDLSKVDWSKAAALSNWKVVTGGDTDKQLLGKLTHDSKYLYIQLEDIMDPKTLGSTGNIWFDDAWELHFAAKRQPPYRQLAINPGSMLVGYIWTDLTLKPDVRSDWDSGAIVDSKSDLPDRWQVNIALPLDKLIEGGVKPGQTFYSNFYRTGANVSKMLAWSPNYESNYHVLDRLGALTLE